MESFSSALLLEACELERYAQQFMTHGYVTLDRCMKLKKDDLSVMGIDHHDRQKLLDLAGHLKGRGEVAAVQELLVSIVHTLSYRLFGSILPDK